MRIVEQLEQCLDLARQVGYGIRHEWLDGSGGGACEIGGKKWIFVDLAQTPAEQLDQVVEAIHGEPALAKIGVPDDVQSLFDGRRAA